MAPSNRYDSPARDNYFNTYVPLPFEQLMPVVAARQSQLQREQDMLSKTYEDTQNIKYIPGTKDETYVRNYLGKTANLVDKYYGQDLSDPIVKQQLRSEFNKITNKQNIQNIEGSQAAWATNQKLKAQLKAEGLYDPAIDEDPANANWDTIGGGRAYDYITSPYKNPRPAAEPYFNNMEASDWTDKEGIIHRGITKSDINRVAEAKWGDFADTSEGRLYIKKIAKEQGIDPNDKVERKRIAMEYLKGVGEEKVYNQIAPGQSGGSRGNGSDQNKVLTWQTQPILPDKEFDPLKVGELNFDEKGNFKPDQTVSRPTGYGGAYGTLEVSSSEPIESQKAAAKVKLDMIREKIPQLKGLSDNDTYTAYKDISNDARSFGSLPLIDISDRARPGLASYIANTLTNKDMYIEDGFGSTDTRNANDTKDGSALEEVGWTPQMFSDQLMEYAAGRKSSIRMSGLDPGARKAGMLQGEILDKSKSNKGKWRKFFIDTNRDFEQITAPGQQVFQKMRNMEEGPVLVGYDKATGKIPIVANVKTNIVYDKNIKKWKYAPTVEKGYMTENGYVKIDDMRIDDILNKQLQELEESGLLNSQIGETAPTNSFQ